jgi:hypothetical protein
MRGGAIPNRNLLLAVLGGALVASGASQPRAPVLVELFTSEGCSSCPPADRLLEYLDPQAIVLSEHVDYWNHDGWKDPFSLPVFTRRQEAYSRRFDLESAYTPEMVVDGETEFNGADGRRALAAISAADRRSKAEVRISRIGAGLLVEVGTPPASADILLILAQDSGTSEVSAGENNGRRLHHVAIVRSIRKIGSVKRGAGFSREIGLPPDAGSGRIVVFLQESDQGRVVGAAMTGPVQN